MIRIGTRGSALALAQAGWVAERIGETTELVTITTAGDRGAEREDKSRWVSELERALLGHEVDIAVHSAKDVPAELADGLALLGIPERVDPHDVICGADSLGALPPGARVGTSSLRRQAQLRATREDLDVVAIRGNVDTRLRKLHEGEFDAIVLAAAGLERLGRRDEAGGVLDELVPAAGQGALFIEGRVDAEPLAALTDPATATCVEAERRLVHRLGASCNTPVGAHARWLGVEELELSAWVGLPDGSAWISDRLSGAAADRLSDAAADRLSDAASELGDAVAERLLAVGAGDLLAQAERVAT